jgi:hypothetical protein
MLQRGAIAKNAFKQVIDQRLLAEKNVLDDEN